MTWFERTKVLLAQWKAQEAGDFAKTSIFTPRAQQAMALARKESDRLHHEFLGTEHLLLGIIKLGQGVCINVLQSMDVNLGRLGLEVEKYAPGHPSDHKLYAVPYTPRMKRVIELARANAQILKHTHVGTEHFLLGLLADGDGAAAKALKHFNVDFERARKQILIELDPNSHRSGDAKEAKN